MESIFPFFMVCVVPLVWTALVFMLGRWSARHRIIIEPNGKHNQPSSAPYRQQPQDQRPQNYYEHFEEV